MTLGAEELILLLFCLILIGILLGLLISMIVTGRDRKNALKLFENIKFNKLHGEALEELKKYNETV